MDFIFVSMPYAKFNSKWFANVPNINLGLVNAMLTEKGRQVQTFHFHLEFAHFLKNCDTRISRNLMLLSDPYGVEYLSLDYVFASILFENLYRESIDRFKERLSTVGLKLDDFEELRDVVKSFIESCLSKLSPYLEKTRLIGFSCSHYQLSGSLLLCAMVKQAYSDTMTVFGGKDCSGAFGHELLSCIDFVDFVGDAECEVTVEGLIEHVEDGRKPFCNVIYRADDGQIRRSESRPNLSRDLLPFPKYDFQDISLHAGDIILPLELGRGCPWGKCTFCPDASYNVRCQTRAARDVGKEIEHYQGISGDLKNFIIIDSDALKDPRAVIDLAEYLDGRDLAFHFGEFRAERMEKDVLQSLLRFGNWISPFQVGIETFDDSLLRLMKKGVGALRNVEVLKMAAELGVPLQFNLFTCYPNMTRENFAENLRVMDSIVHLLVFENIEIYPGEFYLPTDCPVFLNIDGYGLEKNDESFFSDVFEDFPMPSYSNYPYQYEFDNQDEQIEMSAEIREKVSEIQGKSAGENFMHYEVKPDGLYVTVCLDGRDSAYYFVEEEMSVYMIAVDKAQKVSKVCDELGIGPGRVNAILDDFENKKLILFSADRKSFLSLAIQARKD